MHPHAIDLLTQSEWDQAEKMLALALATHQVVNENTDRIRQLAVTTLIFQAR